MQKNNFREHNEKLAFVVGFVLLLVASYILFNISIFVAIALILFQLANILITKRQMYGNALEVTQDQFPEIHAILEAIISKLNIAKPKIFIEQNPYLNAYAFGFKKPYLIVLSSSLVEGLNKTELAFVIAHEVAHIYFGHTRWLSIISPLGQNNYFLNLLYGDWQRKTEYSSDNLGLFLSNNINSPITALIKTTIGPNLEKKFNIKHYSSK